MNRRVYVYLMFAVTVILSGIIARVLEAQIFFKLTLIAGCIIASIGVINGNRCEKKPEYTIMGSDNTKYAAPQMTFSDVAANDEARASLMGLVDYLRDPEKYTMNGARMPRGILLYGPPGTGKTLLAKALAGEAKVPFIAMNGSDFVQMYVGVGAGRVRDLFKKARKAGKCVIFIDEIDALGRRRNDNASDERDQTLNALLSEMSGFREGNGIIVVAATNRMEVLDPALLRPGRFDRIIEVGLPGKKERIEILRLHSRNKKFDKEVNIERIAEDTCTFSGAALEALLNEAAIIASSRGDSVIGRDDIETAYVNTVAGADKMTACTREERCIIALHEAGHAVLARFLTPENRLKRVSILPAGRSMAGYNLVIPKEKSLMSKADMENQISVILGGRAAELLINGRDGLTSGASGDLAKAAELAGIMITELGMGQSPEIGIKALGIACGGNINPEPEVRKVLSDAFERTMGILEENSELLMKMTEKLLKHEVLGEDEISEIFATYEA